MKIGDKIFCHTTKLKIDIGVIPGNYYKTICPICKSKDVNSGTQGSAGIDSTGRISWSGFFHCNNCSSMFSKSEIKNGKLINEKYEIHYYNLKKIRKLKLDTIKESYDLNSNNI